MKFRTECVQVSESRADEWHVAVLWTLACMSSVFFACVGWLHATWQAHRGGGSKTDDADAGARGEEEEKKKCRRAYKSGTDRAIEAAEKALRIAAEADECGAAGRAAAKKARKAAADALVAVGRAKKAIDEVERGGAAAK